MTNLRKVWSGHAEESGRDVFRALRASALLRNAAQRGRRRRSHGDADVAAERRGGLQALQPGEAWHDAGGTREARPSGQRARIDSKGVNGGRAGTRTPDLLRVKQAL